jgi:hypothetical protein
MSEVSSFFRHCPSCGRRFHIKLVSKTLVDLEREKVERQTAVSSSPMRMGSIMGATIWSPLIVKNLSPSRSILRSFNINTSVVTVATNGQRTE